MSSARTPRHSAGDALPAPPRAPARKHTRTRGAHTQGLTNTNTRTHTRTRTPHGHTLVHAPADTPPPPPPSPRMLSRREAPRTRPRANARSWEHRGDGAPRTHTHTQTSRAAVPAGSLCLPRNAAPSGSSPLVVTLRRALCTHTRPCTMHPPQARSLPSITQMQAQDKVPCYHFCVHPCSCPTRECHAPLHQHRPGVPNSALRKMHAVVKASHSLLSHTLHGQTANTRVGCAPSHTAIAATPAGTFPTLIKPAAGC